MVAQRCAAKIEVGFQRHGLDLRQRFCDVALGKEGREIMRSLSVESAVVHVALDVGSVFQDDRGHVGGRRRAIDRPFEPVVHELWQISDVVEVPVRNDHAFHLRRRHR